jgi:hypothetical protein
MTRRLIGLAAAAALWLGATADARAQFSMAIGNPYTGSNLFVGNGLGLGGFGYGPLYGAPFGGYGFGLGAPVGGFYRSGYFGVGPGFGVPRYGPAVGFGFPAYRYGFRRGFVRPYRGRFYRNRFRW